jgi:hypothetical protein
VPGRYQFSLPGRRQRDGWFRIGSIDMTTTALLVAAGIVSMFWYAIDQASLTKLAYTGYDVRHGDVWRVVTWPIVNPPNDIFVVLTLWFFWFVGHSIEDRIGKSRFVTYMFAVVVAPSIVVALLGFDPRAFTFGFGTVGISLLVVFALDNPGAQFFFGIPAWVLAAVYVGIEVLRNLGDRAWEQLTLELTMILVAMIAARQNGMLADVHAIPKFTGDGNTRGTSSRPAARPRVKGKGNGKGKGQLVDGPWASPAPHHSPADEAELNHLLDKISAAGIDALNRDEKQRLNELSKKLRGR